MVETEVGPRRAPRLTRSSAATAAARGWAAAHASDLLISTLAIALVSVPLVARSRESLDFANGLWMAWVAGKGTIAAGHPVLFTNTGGEGPFYPLFAFYGGTLFLVTGLLGQLFDGQMLATYIGVWVLGIASAYVGTLSLARQVGVRGVLAHAPAICVITAAYYITVIYARGDFPEFVAVSSIPPLAASALHLVRAPRWRPLPVLVFAVSAVIFTGAHNLTLIWGMSFAAVALLALWLALGRPWRLPYRRLAAVAALGVAALCVNGWFLTTDLLHARDVSLGTYTTGQGGVSAIFDSLGVLLNPFRYLPRSLWSGGSPTYLKAFFVNAPMWFLAWGLLGGAVALRRGDAPARLRRVWLAAVFLVVLMIFVIANPWWSSVPFPWDETQFPYRVNSYLIFAVAGLVGVAALVLQRADAAKLGPRTVATLKASLVAAVAISVALCVWQQWAPGTKLASYYVEPGAQLVSVNSLPSTWYASADYGDASAPIVQVAQGRIMWIPWTKVRGDYFSGWVSAPPGPTPIETDIFGGDYVVQIEGVQLLGRVSSGQAVVGRLTNGNQVHVVVRTAPSRSIFFGRILSVLGLAVLLAVLGSTALGLRLVDVRRLLGRVARRARVAGDH
jgi:hypothetical protein